MHSKGVRNSMGLGVVIAGTAFGLSVLPIVGQAPPRAVVPEPPQIDRATQLEIIDSITTTLNDYYVFPEVAKGMESYVRNQFKDRAYEEIKRLDQFTMALTRDLQKVSKDRHLQVRFDPTIADIDPNREMTEDEMRQRHEERMRRMANENYGFKELKILPGNVGYLDLRGFNPAGYAGATAIAAMQFLANSDAVIIDLRKNGGGSPSMIQLISSYFFEEPTHLNSFYWRETDSIAQFWTHAWVEGNRMSETPLYVLTSDYTFSAAEEFTYNMKNLERATIVGETTGGGAHPVDGHIFPSLLVGVAIPTGRAINPITGTNWEGTGVAPHIETASEEALDAAYQHALEQMLNAASEMQPDIEWALIGLKAKDGTPSLSESERLEYVGTYGPRNIAINNNELVYERMGTDNGPMRMMPLTEDVFGFEEIDWFRLKFERDDLGDVVAVVGMYENGQRERNPRGN